MPTIAEKILAAHCGRSRVEAGEIVEAKIDYVMLNDVTGLPAFETFNKNFKNLLAEKVVLIPDHYVPNKDIKSAEQAKAMRSFAEKHSIQNYFEIGRGGVCHQIMVEKGFVAPGRLIIGADSHTCTYGALGAFSTGIGSTEAACAMVSGDLWFKVPETQKFTVSGKLPKYSMGKDVILHIIGDIGVDGSLYKAMEFYGDAISSLPLSDRMSVSNMAIEAGGKAGIIPPDQKVFDYLKDRVKGDYKPVYADDNAEYVDEFNYEASKIVPTVAQPYLPENTKPASEVEVAVDQVYIGSCTNGRLEDLRAAARILKGKSVKVRTIVVPASTEVYEKAMEEGLLKTFIDAGAYVSGPTCGACLGGYMGVLAAGEVCVSTTNRNFIGRMGHKESKVYLANPYVAAASAITGRITDPSDL